MPTASPPDTLLRLPFQGADPQRIVARWCGAALALAAPLALLPSTMLPNAVPLALVFACGLAVLVAGLPARAPRFDLATPISLAFAAVGLLYVGASFLELLPTGAQRPVRPDFVFRHSYYVLVWLPLMAGTAALFRNLLPDLARLARHAALPALTAIAVGDVVTSILLGDPSRLDWEGYTSFFDPGALTFLYALAFFFAVAATGRIWPPLAIASIHCALSNAAGYGMMFDTVTGMFVFVCMWAFALTLRRSSAGAFFVVMALGGALVLGLMAGSLLPDLIGFDVNTQWRFLVWRENLFAALSSGSLGVGFGTPYYELSSGNVAEAYRLTKFAEFTQYALSSPIDILYIRGQHSSFVNAFYRMGLLGGGLLIAFNVAVLILLARAMRAGAPEERPLLAAAGAVFIVEASQIGMHVGLESPRYYAAYALAVGLARAAAHLAQRRDA
jgi:hypothetical protein